MSSINNRFTRFIISILLGIPSYAVFALIRNFPFDQITSYAYIDYSLTAIATFMLIFELQHWKSKFLNKSISWSASWQYRVLIELITSLLVTSSVVYLTYSFLYRVVWDTDIYLPSLYFYICLVFFISLCFMAFVNVVPLIEGWKKSILMTESLEKENIKNRMEALRNQLSPHFFFNNLSILNGLISENPTQAKNYISKLSDVFRYILSNKNNEIVPLEEEIVFIKKYIFLLETRFRNKFKVSINVDGASHWIPPVTLQQLIENAVKHNETSYSRPLEINLRQEADFLIVENNLQLKKTPTESTGIGLSNIIQRFELLTVEPVTYIQRDNIFSVRIPLISNYESGNS